MPGQDFPKRAGEDPEWPAIRTHTWGLAGALCWGAGRLSRCFDKAECKSVSLSAYPVIRRAQHVVGQGEEERILRSPRRLPARRQGGTRPETTKGQRKPFIYKGL